MKLTLSDSEIEGLTDRLKRLLNSAAEPQESSSGRQPVHVVYGGAHLFKPDTARRLGRLADESFRTYVGDASQFAEIFALPPETATTVYGRVAQKLDREAVEDFRVDFEDGYGIRSDAEEDSHALAARKTWLPA